MLVCCLTDTLCTVVGVRYESWETLTANVKLCRLAHHITGAAPTIWPQTLVCSGKEWYIVRRRKEREADFHREW